MARSLLDIATSALPYLACSFAMYLLLDVSYLLVLAVAIPASGFLLRTFIVFHDCAHGSFFRSKRANAWLGAMLGLMVFTPFASWRHSHARHHATVGDLDRRGEGDVLTLTVAEYYAKGWRSRMAYRLFRNPLVMFGFGPVWAMVIAPRMVSRSARRFFSGNIGLHHVHHLSARVPNYNLPRAHAANPVFHGVPTLTLWDGLMAVRLKLWDEDGGRLVTWRDARRSKTAHAA